MKNEIISAADVVASSAINGVAQGIVVVLLISLGLKLAGKTNAATRYAIWFSALLLLGALPVAHALRTCLVPPSRDSAHQLSIGPEAGTGELSFLIASEEADSAESQYSPRAAYDGSFIDEPVNDGVAQEALLSPENSPRDIARNPGFGAQVAVAESTPPPPPSNAITSSASLAGLPSAIPAFLKSMGSRLWRLASPSVIIGTPSFRYMGAGLVLLWAAVSTIKIVQMLLHLRAIRRLKREAKSAPGWLGCFFRQLYQRSGVARPVELKVSESVQSPVLLGFWRPVILFPQQIPTDSVEPVLRHELAHVARRDDWTNLAQQTVCALFFFHPGVWWVSRKLSLEREIACDDHVLQEGSRPGHYAMLLMDLAGRLQGSRRLALLAPGVSTNKSQLKQRIDMILDTKRNRSARLGKIRLGLMTCLGTLAAAMAVYGAPRIILAHQDSATAASAGDAADNSEENVVSVVGISENVSEGEPVAPDAPPAPEGVEPGPKFKAFSGPSIKIAAPGAVLVAPVPPVPPVPMIAAAAPPAPSEPGKPRAGRVHFADGSLEERLNRLERMVESLMAQQGVKPRLEFHWKESGDHDFKIDRKEIEKNQEMARRQVEDARKQIIELDIENITENARKEAMRASEDARRAGREAQKALAEQQRQNRDLKEGSEKQLEALRKHHEMLKREMEKLDRQIQEIQQHRDHWGHPDNREIDQNENENQNLNEDLNENTAPQPAKR